jgi:hypothetical protein
MICWSDSNTTTAGGGRCVYLYSKNDGDEFTHPFLNLTQLTKAVSLNAGRLCESGFAVLINPTTARCLALSNITSIFDNYTTGVTPGLDYKECSLTVLTINSTNSSRQQGSCRYEFNNITVGAGLRSFNFFDFCECTLNNEINVR